jgi:hypothetical protein
MDDLLLKNELFRHFEERTTVELRMALDEVKWWNELAAQGVIKPEEANVTLNLRDAPSTPNFMYWDFLSFLAEMQYADSLLFVCSNCKSPIVVGCSSRKL